jgi:stage III sporulation protein SpoIIIAA
MHGGTASVGSQDRQRETPDDLSVLLAALPEEIVEALNALPDRESLIEVVLDLGRRPEARYPNSEVTLLDREIVDADLQHVVEHIGSFGDDNRAGIERTLHRISAIRNRNGKVVGLTLRIGRAVYGTIEIIAGDGDIPHPAIGKARRMQVRTPSLQHEVMIEAVENHMPQVIVIDEIGTELEAQAARTIAERGVQLIGTAHGNNLDNLMLNPTLSDLIGGIQSVTLGDEEARRRRSQKSVLERKAPPTFDVIVEIQDRERVLVHSDVAATVDAMLLGDAVAPELRWRDEEGVHRSQSRPKPSAREAVGGDRFSGLTGSGAGAWGRDPGWRGAGSYRTGGYAGEDRLPQRPGYRPGASGGWRSAGRGSDRTERGAPAREGDRSDSAAVIPGERFAVPPNTPFVAGEIADRGPLERAETAAAAAAEVRARDARELHRQQAWRAEAARALNALHEDEGTRPVNAAQLEAAEEARIAAMVPGEDGYDGDDGDPGEDDEAGFGAAARTIDEGSLPTLRVFPHGVSRKRLEQAIKDLQLPVIIARQPDEADVAMTLRSEYRQKPPALREVEERGLPIYVLKANTIAQMQASLTSIFSLEVDPREAAMSETEQAIRIVIKEQEPVELSPQNAYIRRLQHQMAERANVVSRSRGREPYRRVRLYPEEARPTWR